MPSPRFVRPLALAALLALPWPMATAAEPVRYTLDPVHTRVLFTVDHAGFSKAIGTVSGSTGSLVFDPGDWSVAAVDVSVPLTRLDLGDEKWNRAALGDGLLDGADHPTATFVSNRVVSVDTQHAKVYGTLTLRGISREIELMVTLNALKRHPLPPFRRTAGFSAVAMLSRKDFGVAGWPSLIGDSVELRIEAEATRAGRADDESVTTATGVPRDDSPVPDQPPGDASEPEPAP